MCRERSKTESFRSAVGLTAFQLSCEVIDPRLPAARLDTTAEPHGSDSDDARSGGKKKGKGKYNSEFNLVASVHTYSNQDTEQGFGHRYELYRLLTFFLDACLAQVHRPLDLRAPSLDEAGLSTQVYFTYDKVFGNLSALREIAKHFTPPENESLMAYKNESSNSSKTLRRVGF
ncbi:hypothetical protein BT96DRAFT_931137 [Gymnopus androsaceus JB14]|uniref:Uncharacterized protein n=1 Tax=Gymnopus androsaceus JB14 TaxID=1447944 RepID=A0A6A4INQ1_9AGAR|nr:hypothetical protein BT96DRAFT_931137 [Gymnopus androsaceus JB14]